MFYEKNDEHLGICLGYITYFHKKILRVFLFEDCHALTGVNNI